MNRPKEMVRLSSIAYDGPSSIQGALTPQPPSGPDGAWTLVWGPAYADNLFTVDNLIYVARRGASPGEYAVVIRGTTFDDLESWLDDLPDELDPWSWAPGEARVTRGLQHVFDQMTTEHPRGDGSVGEGTLLDFLKGVAPAAITVTGHSQGGATSTMMGVYLHQVLPVTPIQLCTFAGETAGNAAFADLVTGLFPGAWRYRNTRDIVPLAWNRLDEIADLYASGNPPDDVERALIDGAWDCVKDKGFAQPGGDGVALPGAPHGHSFAEEAKYQHAVATYQGLVGALP